jgi:hypothetical protein
MSFMSNSWPRLMSVVSLSHTVSCFLYFSPSHIYCANNSVLVKIYYNRQLRNYPQTRVPLISCLFYLGLLTIMSGILAFKLLWSTNMRYAYSGDLPIHCPTLVATVHKYGNTIFLQNGCLNAFRTFVLTWLFFSQSLEEAEEWRKTARSKGVIQYNNDTNYRMLYIFRREGRSP